jgi:threonine/homoserine/homoserine lactone efflux protein
MLLIFLKAYIIGFSIAMPVGPIGMICIKNSLRGFKLGFAVGVGAAFAHSLYGFLAGGGFAFISKFLLDYSSYLKIIGGLILIYLGIKEIIHNRNLKKNKNIKSKKSLGFKKTAISVFFITLTNPVTILSFVGIFASIGGANLKESDIILMIMGVFSGSISWWLILSTTVSTIRHKISENAMHIIKNISGLILIGFGVWAFMS